VTTWVCRAAALVLVALGLGEFVGGARLVQLGGSPYYALAGLALAAAGVTLWLHRSLARVILHCWLGATMVWALVETHGEFWGMVSRIGYPLVVWLVGLLLSSLPRTRGSPPRTRPDVMSPGRP